MKFTTPVSSIPIAPSQAGEGANESLREFHVKNGFQNKRFNER